MSITRQYDVPLRHYLGNFSRETIMRAATLAIEDTSPKDFPTLAKDLAETLPEPVLRDLIEELKKAIW